MPLEHSPSDPRSPDMRSARVQIDLPKLRVEALDRLAAEAGLATRKDLFNNALSLLEWAVKHVRQGHLIAAVDERTDRMIELHMPFLGNLAKHAERE